MLTAKTYLLKKQMKKERQKTHTFCEQIKAQGRTALNYVKPHSGSSMLHPERTGGGQPAIDRELERYYHPYPRHY